MASMAAKPLEAASTLKPRLSRKRETVCRMSIESSITRASIDMRSLWQRLSFLQGLSFSKNHLGKAMQARARKRQEIASTNTTVIEPPALGENSGFFRPDVL